MELLDRYLQAVKKHLPGQRRDDILAELRANLESQLEDKESELGRPLTTAEAEAWLKQIGPPMQMAARYQPQQYLIGPAIFPTYWYVLRLAFFWASIVYLIVSTALILFGDNPSVTGVIEAVLRLPSVLMSVATWVTLIFAAVELTFARYPAKCATFAGSSIYWSPSSLPPIEKESVPGKKPRSFAQAVAEVIFGFFFLVWLLLIPRHPFLLLGPGVFYMQIAPFQLAPVWMQFFWWLVALNLLQLIWQCSYLWRGTWQTPRRVQRIAIKVFGLIPLAMLLSVRDHAYVTLKHPALDQQRLGATLNSINYWTYRSLLLICAIAILQLVWEIGQIILDAKREGRQGS